MPGDIMGSIVLLVNKIQVWLITPYDFQKDTMCPLYSICPLW